MTRNPSVLNTSGATSTSGSQASGESSTSQDKGIKGATFIALAAENSNFKSLIAEVTNYNCLLGSGGRREAVKPSCKIGIRDHQKFCKSFTLPPAPALPFSPPIPSSSLSSPVQRKKEQQYYILSTYNTHEYNINEIWRGENGVLSTIVDSGILMCMKVLHRVELGVGGWVR